MSFLIGFIKVVFLLSFLIFIHEGAHFIVARLCKVNVREFSIGFGPILYSKKSNSTLYSIRWIPFGGFVDMYGENENIKIEGSFASAKIWKRILIVLAGPIINIVFAILLFLIIMLVKLGDFENAFIQTVGFIVDTLKNFIYLFSGNISINDFSGPIGISSIIVKTNSFLNYIYLMSLISLSLGITNLLPIPALDGGKILLLLIETIRKKPLSEDVEIKIQTAGFLLIIILAVYISFNDVLKIL